MFSIALDSWRPSSSARSSRSSSPPGLDAHAVEDDRAERAAAAAQRDRDGAASARSSADRAESRRARAASPPPPAPADRRRSRGRRAPGAPGPTTPGARAGARADRESRPTCGRRRTGGWRRGRRCRGPAARFSVAERLARELVEQLAQVALQLVVLPQAEQLERRQERVGDLGGVAAGSTGAGGASRSRSRAARPARRRARAAAAAPRGVPSRAARSGIWRSASATSVGVAARERVGDERASRRRRASTDRSAARRGRSPTWPAARRCAGCARRAASSVPPVTSSACWCSCGSRSVEARVSREQRRPAAARRRGGRPARCGARRRPGGSAGAFVMSRGIDRVCRGAGARRL